jgi:DNA-binding transcriptional MerR regulator
MKIEYQLTCITETPIGTSLVTLDEASDLSGMHPEMIEEFLRAHLIRAFKSDDGTLYFDPSGIHRLRQIQYFREHEGTNLRTIRYIVSLLDSLDQRDRELRTLRDQLI